MSLSGNISASAGSSGNKDLTQAYQPLLLAVFTWPDGTTLRLSTHPLNTAEGGYQYGGHDYFARLLEQNIDAVQAMSDNGVDIPPTLNLKIADADRFVWTNYEQTEGFKGATLVVTLVLWEADTANYSSDSYTKFTGICNPATLADEATLTVSAISKMAMQKTLLPIIPIQTRCPWIFPGSVNNPGTLQNRTDALSNPDSPFFECGYSADVGGGVGTLNGGVAFTSCGYTKADCQARGMYTTDSGSHQTGHFGGVQWEPPLWWKGKGYLEGKTISGINSPNEGKYGAYVPYAYGKVFVNPVVLNVIGDANSTRMEALVCFGDVGGANNSTGSSGGIQMVIVNNIAIPYNFNQVGGARPDDALFRWQYVNTGGRTSAPNSDAGYNSLGDPYGNLCVIEIVVPKVVADSQSLPSIQVLLTAPKIRVYSNPSTFTLQTTSNPVWALMDLLIQANWLYSQLNIQSFIDAAAVCDVQINYTNNSGVSGNTNADGSPHRRYSLSLTGNDRRSAADVLRGVRNSCKAMLVPNDSTGLLQIFIKQSMADQQSGAIAGSNNGSTISSTNAAGSAANGYSAYDFDESSILEKADGTSTLTVSQRTILDSPNRISVNFQDQDNQWVSDSMTEADPGDISRSGQEVPGGVQAEGLNSFDQGQRIFEGIFAETYRGNSRNDSGGTMVFEFDTTQKIAHLRVGHICRFSHHQLGFTHQMVRVIKLQPSRDHETVKVTLQWHNDAWYVDTYGQSGSPIYSGAGKQPLYRPPYGWQPFQEAPLSSDQIFSSTNYTFGLAQVYTVAQDGTAIATLQVTGKLPVNSFPNAALQPPLIGLQGTTATTGGTIPGGTTVFAVVVPWDSVNVGPPTGTPCVITTATATNTNTVTIPVVSWPPSIAGYYVFAGRNANRMTYQGRSASNPSSITLTSLNEREYGVPDIEEDHIALYVTHQIHGGVWGLQVNAVTATTLKFTGSTFTTNQWAGYDLTITGRAGLSSSLPVWNLRIASNTADTLTVAGGTPNLTTLPSSDPSVNGINVGDVAVMRAKPDTFTSTTIGDSNFVNNAGGVVGTGLAVNEGNYVLRIFGGTGRGQWRKVASNTATVYTVDTPFDTTPDATSRFWIEDANAVALGIPSTTSNSDITANYTGTAEISNYAGQSIVVQAFTVDSQGNESFEQDAPVRDLYVFGSAGTINLASGTAVPNVTPGTITYAYTSPDAQATGVQPTTLELTVPYTIPGGWTGTGVHAWVEYPDGSAGGGTAAWFDLSGTVPLDGTTPIAGDFKPIDGGLFPIGGDPIHQAVIKGLTPPKETVSIRVYLASYNSVVDNPLVRATLPSPTPSATVSVDPPKAVGSGGGGGTVGSGQEYAALVSGITVSDQYSGNLPTYGGIPSPPGGSRTAYLMNGQGLVSLNLTIGWNDPDDPNFGGIFPYIIRADGNAYPLSAGLVIGYPNFQNTATTTIHNYPTAPEVVTVYILSASDANHVNSYVDGVTPAVTLVLQPPTFGTTAGLERTVLVTGQTATVLYKVSGDGNETYAFQGSWVNPDPVAHPEFGGAAITIRDEAGLTYDRGPWLMPPGATTWVTDYWPLNGTQPVWDIYFGSRDINNKQNTIVPGLTPSVDGLQPGLQTTGKIVGGRVDPTTLESGVLTVTSSKLAVAQNGITGGATGKLALATVSNVNIVAHTITAAQILAGTITATEISAGYVYAGTINCSQLNAGTITAAISITSPTITCTNGFSITGGGVTTTITNQSSSFGSIGLSVQVTSSPNMAAYVTATGFHIISLPGTANAAFMGASGGTEGEIQLNNTGNSNQISLFTGGATSPFLSMTDGTNVMKISGSLLRLDNLPAASPGVGTKQFWYDPADGDRVKFAA